MVVYKNKRKKKYTAFQTTFMVVCIYVLSKVRSNPMLFEWIWERDKRRCSNCVYKGEQCGIWKEPYTGETTPTGFDKNLAVK